MGLAETQTGQIRAKNILMYCTLCISTVLMRCMGMMQVLAFVHAEQKFKQFRHGVRARWRRARRCRCLPVRQCASGAWSACSAERTRGASLSYHSCPTLLGRG